MSKSIERLERDRRALQELMHGDIPYNSYNALIHAIWGIDRQLREIREAMIPKSYSVTLREIRTYELELEAGSPGEAELLARQAWNSGDLVGGFELEAEVN